MILIHIHLQVHVRPRTHTESTCHASAKEAAHGRTGRNFYLVLASWLRSFCLGSVMNRWTKELLYVHFYIQLYIIIWFINKLYIYINIYPIVIKIYFSIFLRPFSDLGQFRKRKGRAAWWRSWGMVLHPGSPTPTTWKIGTPWRSCCSKLIARTPQEVLNDDFDVHVYKII